MPTSSVLYASFVETVRLGSVTAAARALELPRGTVSRHLRRLEQDLGVALLHRTTRSVSTTTAGQRLYEGVTPLLSELSEVEADVRADAGALEGTVRVSVLPLLAPNLSPVIAALHDQHPRLTVEVAGNVRLVDLRNEGFDAAIWAGDPRDPDLISRTLAAGNVGLVASPAYLDRRGVPLDVPSLSDHALLRGHSSMEGPRVWWPLVDGGRFRVAGRFVTNDQNLMLRAAVDGLGIALLSDLKARDALRDGRLVRVLPDVVGVTASVRLLVARRTGLPHRVRAFVDALVEHFRI